MTPAATRFVRWGITGTLTVGLDVILFRSIYPLTESVLFANAISTPVVTAFNYLMHHKWSFQATRGHQSATSRYLATLVAGYLINSALVSIALSLGASPALAKLAAVPVQAPINFLAFNLWVFHSRQISGRDVEV